MAHHFNQISCPDCGCIDLVKNGKQQGKQEFMCLEPNCKRQFREDYSYNAYDENIRSKVVIMSQNGSGIRDISRVLNIATKTVMSILKKKKSNLSITTS